MKATPVSAIRFTFWILMVMTLVAPMAKSVAMMFFTMIGAATAVTVTGALAAVPVKATGPVAVGALVVLVPAPATLEVMFRLT